MDNQTRCRRCLLREAYPEDYEKYVASLLQRLSPENRAADDLYARRLEACRACDQLNSGTCMGCGCLVELKAAYAKEKCPFKKW